MTVLEFDRVNGIYILNDQDTFDTKEELINHIKTLEGSLEVHDLYTNSIIYLKDGECTGHESEWGMEDKENNRLWCGIESEDYDEGMRRMSVYDVYSERELL